MPDRNIEGEYRYAYQGQEKDAETGMEAFELRMWDARIGRWLTTDPAGQYSSPYLGMGNNPISRVDPDGGLDWHYDNDGNLVSDAGDNAQTLAKFKGISLSEAQNIISSEGFFTDFNNSFGTDLMEGQVGRNYQSGSPYIIGNNIKVSKYNQSTNGLGSGWNSFTKRPRGPSSSIYGNFDVTARVSIYNGQHYLTVTAGAYTPNDPRNKNGSYLNIKNTNDESLREATNSYKLELLPLPLMPENYTYLGHKTILLPNNPNDINRLWIIASVHTIGTGAVPAMSASLETDLLPLIQYGK